jgi:uncharacterized protein (DUF885 family)
LLDAPTISRHIVEDRLRDGFHVSDFHDVVLGSDMCPLPALEQTVTDWMASVGQGPPA